jgi:hypothetical protein
MTDSGEFHYEPRADEPLSTAVVVAIAAAHDENVRDQEWLISEEIHTDALDGLFQEQHRNMSLQFEANLSTVTIVANEAGNPLITIHSHR